jgi:hypothetical protein
VCAQQAATLGDAIFDRISSGHDPITHLRPSSKPSPCIPRADVLDRLEDLGRIGTIGRNIVQHTERLKMVSLIREEPTPPDITMEHARISLCDRVDPKHRVVRCNCFEL